MDQDKYDDMLQEMTLALREIYEQESGNILSEADVYSLNDILDIFFCEKV